MRQFFIAFALLTLLTLFAPFSVVEKAHACSCMNTPAAEIIENADMIFRGRAVAEEISAEKDGDSVYWKRRYAFSIEKVWKGIPMNGMVVETSFDSAACGVRFTLHEDVTVIAYRRNIFGEPNDKTLSVGSCSQIQRQDVEYALEDHEAAAAPAIPDCTPVVCPSGELHPSCTASGTLLPNVRDACTVKKPGPFKDIPWNHLARIPIQYVAVEGIFKGYDDGTFRPRASITRAELLKTLFRRRNVHETQCRWSDMPFTDVERGSWYGQEVCLAWEMGVVKGFPDRTFRPHQTVSLAEAAKIILRKASYSDQNHFNSLEREALQKGQPWWQQYLDTLEEFISVSSLARSPSAPLSREGVARILHAFWSKSY